MRIIVTERLLIRDFHPADGDDLYAYLSDPEVVRYEPYAPFTREQARFEARERARDHAHRAVVLPDESVPPELRTPGVYDVPPARIGRVTGNVLLRRVNDSCTLGYVFDRRCWGKGYATEAACALAREAFDEGAAMVFANCLPENERSARLLMRLGMLRADGLMLRLNIPGDDGTVVPRMLDTYFMTQDMWRGSAAYRAMR